MKYNLATVLSDNNAVNTDRISGIIKRLSKFTGRNLLTIVCSSHILEIALKKAYNGNRVVLAIVQVINEINSLFFKYGHIKLDFMLNIQTKFSIKMHRISKVSKTRWVASHRNLLEKVTKSWLCFVYMLLHLVETVSDVQQQNIAKIDELKKTLTGQHFLANIHFHLDVISTDFSLTTQYDGAKIVSLNKVLNLVIHKLAYLRDHPGSNLQKYLDNVFSLHSATAPI